MLFNFIKKQSYIFSRKTLLTRASDKLGQIEFVSPRVKLLVPPCPMVLTISYKCRLWLILLYEMPPARRSNSFIGGYAPFDVMEYRHWRSEAWTTMLSTCCGIHSKLLLDGASYFFVVKVFLQWTSVAREYPAAPRRATHAFWQVINERQFTASATRQLSAVVSLRVQ